MKNVIVLLVCFSFVTCSSAETYYVSADKWASDKHDGLVPEYEQGASGPFRTIQHAVQTADDGDTIKILAGTYYEKVKIKNRENLTMMAYGDGVVKISGAISDLLFGNNDHWEFVATRTSPYHEKPFKVYRMALPNRYKLEGGDSKKNFTQYYKNHVYDAKGNVMFTYPDTVAFNDHYVAEKEGEGVCFTYDAIYISLDSLANPNDTTFYISQTGTVLEINDCPNFVLDGGEDKLFEIHHGGSHSMTIKGEMGAEDSIHIKNIKILGGKSGTQVYVGGGKVIVENSIYEYKGNPKWSWADVKRGYGNYVEDQEKSGFHLERNGDKKQGNYGGFKAMESTAFQYSGDGTYVIFRNNEVSGYFNGAIILRPNAEIYNNTFSKLNDDALEFEEEASNVVCHHNFIKDCFRGISMVTVPVGPIYLYENIVDLREMEKGHEFYNFETNEYKDWSTKIFKMGSLPPKDNDTTNQHLTQNCHFYFNSFLAHNVPLEVGDKELERSPLNSSFYNNIFYSEDDVIVKNTGFSSQGMDYDNNIFYTEKTNSEKKYKAWDAMQGLLITTLPQVPIEWSDNEEPLDFEFETDYQLSAATKTWLLNFFSLKTIPSDFPNAESLNTRQFPGAKEN